MRFSKFIFFNFTPRGQTRFGGENREKMSQRSKRGRVVIGSRVVVDIPQDAEVLEYMGLVDNGKKPLENIRMLGEVKSNYGKASWVVYLTAAEKEYHFVKDAVHLLPQGSPVPCSYYCVVDKEIQVIDGLLLPKETTPDGYHLSHTAAEAELISMQNSTADAVAASSVVSPSSS